MDDNDLPVLLVAAGLGLWAQYAIIKAAVYQGLIRFLREAAQSEMREGYDVPRYLDKLAIQLVALTRQPPSQD